MLKVALPWREELLGVWHIRVVRRYVMRNAQGVAATCNDVGMSSRLQIIVTNGFEASHCGYTYGLRNAEQIADDALIARGVYLL